MYEYTTSGTCSSKIYFDIKDDKIRDVSFEGGCNGNLKAISLLVNGKEAQAVIDHLRGVDCGGRGTSCADQLAAAITGALKLREKKALEEKEGRK